MTTGQPDNPRLSPPSSGQANPAKYPVTSNTRPVNIVDLLSRKEVIYQDWEFSVRNKKLYYIDGILSFMKMLKKTKLIFLKNNDYIKKAMDVVKNETDWPEKLNFDWSEDVAGNQLRRVQEKTPICFTKAVYTIVACECAIKELGLSSPYWVYDYMRIVPAVYNIDKLNAESVNGLVKTVGAKENLEKAAGENYQEVLKDLADGHCVTAQTAYGISKYANNYPELCVGSVRFKPGKKRLGLKDASENEYVEIH